MLVELEENTGSCFHFLKAPVEPQRMMGQLQHVGYELTCYEWVTAGKCDSVEESGLPI